MGTSAAVADRRPVWAVCAEQLIDAAATSTPCAPLRDLLPEGTLEDGYGVQRLVHEETGSGRRRVGRKIGLTSAAVQQQMGVDCPDFGVLFADMAFGDAEPIPYDTLMQPRIEAEVAFVLGADLPDRPITAVDVLRATEFVVPAIEVCASRIAEWDITIFDTVGRQCLGRRVRDRIRAPAPSRPRRPEGHVDDADERGGAVERGARFRLPGSPGQRGGVAGQPGRVPRGAVAGR